MWAGVPSEPLCLHTQSLATAQLSSKWATLKFQQKFSIYFELQYNIIIIKIYQKTTPQHNNNNYYFLIDARIKIQVIKKILYNINECKDIGQRKINVLKQKKYVYKSQQPLMKIFCLLDESIAPFPLQVKNQPHKRNIKNPVSFIKIIFFIVYMICTLHFVHVRVFLSHQYLNFKNYYKLYMFIKPQQQYISCSLQTVIEIHNKKCIICYLNYVD
eukprot:TRINITY_DN4829_c0_g1_i13.p1 TRINITY_DN4829_c0_g1~~TRINITY_DN4829_c0_g1_i13.p1  ORF type:complete len:215 (-),score=-9.03 TRINITY_DN4829_c0_g1_i13:123-767(-)